jgi:hypothetical protein
MRIGIIRVYFQIPDSHSLKDKRRVVKSIKDRLMNEFNVSVAEIGEDLDKLQVGEIGIVSVSNEKPHLERRLQKVIDYIEEQGDGLVVLEVAQEIL